jgi:hypothetical protein
MMMLPEAGIIISWDPDCSSQVITVITSSESLLEPTD